MTLAPGLRLQVPPLTTALMVSARADPAIEDLPVTATQEELALAMAKAVARRAVLDWEGVGDDAGDAVPLSPEGIDALLGWCQTNANQSLLALPSLASDGEEAARCWQTKANSSQLGQGDCPYAAQRSRHSARAAMRLALKSCRLERLRS